MPGEHAGRIGSVTELLLLDKEDTGGEDERRAEARMISRGYMSLIMDGVVLDKETQKYRRVRYSDIVILTRSIRGWRKSSPRSSRKRGYRLTP